MSTYMTYLDISTNVLQRVLPDGWQEVVHALTKLFNLDSQFVLEAYNQHEQQKIQDLADNRRAMLATVTSAVQELASLMFELDEGAQSIAATAISTSQSRDKTHTLLGELREELDGINERGTLFADCRIRRICLGLMPRSKRLELEKMGRASRLLRMKCASLPSPRDMRLKGYSRSLKRLTRSCPPYVMNQSKHRSKRETRLPARRSLHRSFIWSIRLRRIYSN